MPDPKSVDMPGPRDASKWLKFSAYRDVSLFFLDFDEHWPKYSEMVNLDALKSKFELCKTKHKAICGARKSPPVSDLLLIDCETMKREVATADMEYVALSYVWGPARQMTYLDGATLNEQLLPRTIRDAANITLRLGFKYLWVDQIRQMHHIYRNSEITIIAAAGDHSDYGIPGCPGMPRLPQIRCRIGDRLYVEQKIDPKWRIQETPWLYRGWTLQEEVMARRTIVFTDREAWFSCACMTPMLGREFSDIKDGSRYSRGRKFGESEPEKNPFLPPYRFFKQTNPEFNISRMFIDLVKSYSLRDLTVRDDVINAFSGILGMFEESNPPVYHIWGSPILPPDHTLVLPKTIVPKPRNPSLEGFIRGLCFRDFGFTRHRPLVRRPGFPSWSWTGWIGLICFRYLESADDGCYPDTGISIAVERTDGTILSWAEFEELAYLKKYPEKISQFIHVQAWTMAVKLENHRLRGNHPPCLYHVFKTFRGKVYNEVEFIRQKREDFETEELHLLASKTYTAILMSSIDRLLSRKIVYFMLVEMKTDHAERVGILRLQESVQRQVSKKRLSLDPDIMSKRDINAGGLKLQWKEIRLG